MVYEGVLHGTTIDMRSVTEDDAAFTRELRRDPVITRFIPRVEGSAEDQAAWIRAQRAREGDYFFLICDKKGQPLGTIGVYDVVDDYGESGRFASFGSSVQNIEAVLLNMSFAFDTLGLAYVLGNTKVENRKVKSMDEKFGYVFDETHMDERGFMVVHGRLYKQDFYARKAKIREMIDKAAPLL